MIENLKKVNFDTMTRTEMIDYSHFYGITGYNKKNDDDLRNLIKRIHIPFDLIKASIKEMNDYCLSHGIRGGCFSKNRQELKELIVSYPKVKREIKRIIRMLLRGGISVKKQDECSNYGDSFEIDYH